MNHRVIGSYLLNIEVYSIVLKIGLEFSTHQFSLYKKSNCTFNEINSGYVLLCDWSTSVVVDTNEIRKNYKFSLFIILNIILIGRL